jgi:hypothetical protein
MKPVQSGTGVRYVTGFSRGLASVGEKTELEPCFLYKDATFFQGHVRFRSRQDRRELSAGKQFNAHKNKLHTITPIPHFGNVRLNLTLV